jgi:hypothetical protein
MLTVGDKFPQFNLQAVVSTEQGKEFETITGESYEGKWKVVFFWPMDFTFICPTEIAEFGKRNADFADRDAQVWARAPTRTSSTSPGATTTPTSRASPSRCSPTRGANSPRRSASCTRPRASPCARPSS